MNKILIENCVEVRRLETAEGERPAPLEKRVWIDALEEAHGERMREKARGRAERSVGFAPGDGRL